MRRRIVILSSAVLAGGLATYLALLLGAFDRGPRYKGMTAAYWGRTLQGPTRSSSIACRVEQLCGFYDNFGKPAILSGEAETIPVLLEVLNFHTPNDSEDAQDRKARSAAFQQLLILERQRGSVYLNEEHYRQALADFCAIIRLHPQNIDAFEIRARIYKRNGQYEKAVADLSHVIEAAPYRSWLVLWLDRAELYMRLREYAKAAEDYSTAIQSVPIAPLYVLRARAYLANKNYQEAAEDDETAIRLGDPLANNDLAWLRATCPVAKMRDGKQACRYAQKACELTAWESAPCLDTLAAACAENGQFEEAVKWQMKAIEIAKGRHDLDEIASLRLNLYKQRKPYQEK